MTDLTKEDVIHALRGEERGSACVNCGSMTWWTDINREDSLPKWQKLDPLFADALLGSGKRPAFYLYLPINSNGGLVYPPPPPPRAWPLCDEDCAEYAYRLIMRLCPRDALAICFQILAVRPDGGTEDWTRNQPWARTLRDERMRSLGRYAVARL